VAQKYGKTLTDSGDSDINVTAGSQLAGGDSIKEIEMIQSGDIDMGVFPIGNISGQIPQTDWPQLPFIFDDYAHGKAFLTGPYAETMDSWFEEKNLHVPAYATAGFRDLASTSQLFPEPSDVKGASIRIGTGDVYRMTFEALGAKPVDMAYGDLHSGLQQGAVNTAESPSTFLLDDNFYKVAPYITRVNYMYQPVVVAIGTDTWDGLTPEQQEALESTAQELFSNQLTDAEADDDAAIKEMADNDATIGELDEAGLQAYRDAVSSVVDDYQAKYGADFDEFLAAVDASREG